MLLHLGPDMLRDQIYRHDVVAALPGDNDVGVAAAGSDKRVEAGFYKARVLLDDIADVAASMFDVSLDAAG